MCCLGGSGKVESGDDGGGDGYQGRDAVWIR